MVPIAVSLWTSKQGELRRFLERYYCKEVIIEEDVGQWVYIYKKPVDAVDLISAVMDNKDKYEINVCIQVDNGDLHPITAENHNDVIKGIFRLFYDENQEAV